MARESAEPLRLDYLIRAGAIHAVFSYNLLPIFAVLTIRLLFMRPRWPRDRRPRP